VCWDGSIAEQINDESCDVECPPYSSQKVGFVAGVFVGLFGVNACVLTVSIAAILIRRRADETASGSSGSGGSNGVTLKDTELSEHHEDEDDGDAEHQQQQSSNAQAAAAARQERNDQSDLMRDSL